MNRVRQLESLTERWLRPFPHLPDVFRRWLTDNAWWLAVLASFISAISALVMLGRLLDYITYINNAPGYLDVYTVVHYPAGWLLTILVGLIYLSTVTVLYAKAATPLKERLRQGWDILFMTLVLGAIQVFLNAVFSFTFFGFVFGVLFGVIFLTIAAYFLFEIRSYFVKAGRVKLVAKR